MEKTNVIFLVADQLRYDMLGKGLTPNIDELAKNSVQMPNAYCASPLCVPARGALFTGIYPNNNGSLINPWCKKDASFGDVSENFDNLYEIMEREGYDCLHSGKQHFFTEGGKLEQRKDNKTKWLSTEQSYRAFLTQKNVAVPGGAKFQSLVPEMASGKQTRCRKYSNANTGCYLGGLEHYFDGYFTDCAVEGIKKHDKTKPLFFSGMFLAPHPPLEIPEPYYSKIKEQDVILPENVGTWFEKQSPLQLYNLTGMVGTKYNLEQWKETWRVYMGLVTLLDDCVGRIINELKAQGLYDNSLIVFTTDHGEMLGSHRLFQKMCMYEESVRTPVYMRLPKDEQAGKCIKQAVSHIDILPTICEYLGHEINNYVDGTSLLNTIQNSDDVNYPVYIQFDGNGSLGNFQRCVILGEYKLILDFFKDEIYCELYNIKNDVQETTNLLFEQDAPFAKAEELLSLLKTHMNASNDHLGEVELDLKQFVCDYTIV